MLKPQTLLILSIMLSLCLPVLPAAAIEKGEYIDTNRPSFSQSAFVVPNGTLQLENGTLYQRFQHGINYFDIPENELRLGIFKKAELQISTPNAFILNRYQATKAGATGLQTVGFKYEIGPIKNLKMMTVAISGGLNLPTGSKLLTPQTSVQGVLSLPYYVQLSKNWAFCGMQSIVLTDSHGDIQYQPFVMLARGLSERASAFVEYAGYFTQNNQAPSTQIAHFGGVYKLAPCHQIDMHFGFGLTKASPTGLVGAGYSYRFDGLPWGRKPSKNKLDYFEPIH